MKAVIVLLILAAVAVGALYLTRGSIEEGFDPTEEGRQARASVKIGAPWTEILTTVGEPRKWKDDTSGFDFVTGYMPYDAAAHETISKKLEANELKTGFCFLYRYSDAATFAVNFDRRGKAINIQDKESKADLMN